MRRVFILVGIILLWAASAHAQIAVVGTSTGFCQDSNHNTACTCSTCTSIIIDKPTGTVSGNQILTFVSGAAAPVSSGTTQPTGFNKISAVFQTGDLGAAGQLWCKDAGGAEPATYTWTFNAGSFGTLGTVTLSGTKLCASLLDVTGNNSGQNTSPIASSITTTIDNNEWFWGAFVMDATSGTFTLPAGLTSRISIPQSANLGLAVGSKGPVNVGATGAFTGTLTGGTPSWSTRSFAFEAAPFPTATPTPSAFAPSVGQSGFGPPASLGSQPAGLGGNL